MHIEDFVYNKIPKSVCVQFVRDNMFNAAQIRAGMRADRDLLEA